MIFNSLGSNYNIDFVFRSLFALNNKKNKLDLVGFLDKKYDGKTTLLYKGREAIKLALDLIGLPSKTKVGITGFTCYAVYKAIVDAGYSPEYIDIEESSLNFSFNELKKHKGIKVLIIQNTLGNPCDIVNIKKYCVENKIILIEDLAHSVGTVYGTGKESGTYGDFVVLSFGQDKIIDAVSGGALVVRNNNYVFSSVGTPLFKVSLNKQIKDRLYPIFTFLIRKAYNIGLGKLTHYILKSSNLLSQPIGTERITKLHDLPSWYCGLVHHQFLKLENNLKHREKIAAIYAKSILGKPINYRLRFPVLVDERKKLIILLKKSGIFISDIWYDAPIAPLRLLKLTNYRGQCPVSEKISNRIINLPTHINVTEKQAERLLNKINQWINIK